MKKFVKLFHVNFFHNNLGTVVLLYSDWTLTPISGQFSDFCECRGLENTSKDSKNAISIKNEKKIVKTEQNSERKNDFGIIDIG